MINNTTVIARKPSLYLERLPTAANPTPLKPSDAKNNGPSQLIHAKMEATTDPTLASFSLNSNPPLYMTILIA